MERSALFYFVFGAGVIIVPAIVERLLEGRIAGWPRFVLSTLATILAGLFLVLIARPLGI